MFNGPRAFRNVMINSSCVIGELIQNKLLGKFSIPRGVLWFFIAKLQMRGANYLTLASASALRGALRMGAKIIQPERSADGLVVYSSTTGNSVWTEPALDLGIQSGSPSFRAAEVGV